MDLEYTPDPSCLTELLDMVQDYNLDAHLTGNSQVVCKQLLQAHSWPVEYKHQDAHRDAYLSLHTRLWDHILHQSLRCIHLPETPGRNLLCSKVKAEFMDEISYESAEYTTDNDSI